MHQFGTRDILTGYIKQLLASFNLPTVKVYTRDQENYFLEHFEEREDVLMSSPLDSGLPDGLPSVYHIPYIKDGKLQEYLHDGWHAIGSDSKNPHHVFYNRGDLILNHTKRFQIKNNIYDQYTHEYLGEYLRFIRDFDNMDLMPLYNCFSNQLCNNLNYSMAPKLLRKRYTETENGTESLLAEHIKVVFNSADPHYKIYMIPVKLFKNYTIALDSSQPVEMFCGFYNTRLDTSAGYQELMERTYHKVGASQFLKPFLFTGLTGLLAQAKNAEEKLALRELLLQAAQRESDLKLFIKMSATVQSTITVLEGDYCSWNDFSATPSTNQPIVKRKNHSVVSNEALIAGEEIPLITPLQLLRLNTGKQMPFANRLIEYLLGNCITGGDDELLGNMTLVQHMIKCYYLNANRHANTYGKKCNVFKYDAALAGAWDDSIRKTIYKQMIQKQDNISHDVLGYVDKDVEKYFTVKNPAGKLYSMLNLDLWEDEL